MSEKKKDKTCNMSERKQCFTQTTHIKYHKTWAVVSTSSLGRISKRKIVTRATVATEIVSLDLNIVS